MERKEERKKGRRERDRKKRKEERERKRKEGRKEGGKEEKRKKERERKKERKERKIFSHSVMEILSDEKPSDTKRSMRTRMFIILYCMPVLLDELMLKILCNQQ
jgi:hypothetical protein